MLRFRLMILLGIVWITLTLNIERPDLILGAGQINIDSFVYLLGAISATIIFAFPQIATLSTQKVFIPLVAVYTIGKILFSGRDLDSPQFLPLVIVELSGLYAGTWLFQTFACSLDQISRVLENTFIGKEKTQVLDRMTGEKVIHRKISLARRFGRNLSLIHVQLNVQPSLSRRFWDYEENLKHVYLQIQLAELMNYLVDLADVRVWYQGNLILCLEDVLPQKAEQTAMQTQQVLKDVLELDTEIGIAHFPNDGLIYEDLLEIAVQNTKLKNRIRKPNAPTIMLQT